MLRVSYHLQKEGKDITTMPTAYHLDQDFNAFIDESANEFINLEMFKAFITVNRLTEFTSIYQELGNKKRIFDGLSYQYFTIDLDGNNTTIFPTTFDWCYDHKTIAAVQLKEVLNDCMNSYGDYLHYTPMFSIRFNTYNNSSLALIVIISEY